MSFQTAGAEGNPSPSSAPSTILGAGAGGSLLEDATVCEAAALRERVAAMRRALAASAASSTRTRSKSKSPLRRHAGGDANKSHRSHGGHDDAAASVKGQQQQPLLSDVLLDPPSQALLNFLGMPSASTTPDVPGLTDGGLRKQRHREESARPTTSTKGKQRTASNTGRNNNNIQQLQCAKGSGDVGGGGSRAAHRAPTAASTAFQTTKSAKLRARSTAAKQKKSLEQADEFLHKRHYVHQREPLNYDPSRTSSGGHPGAAADAMMSGGLGRPQQPAKSAAQRIAELRAMYEALPTGHRAYAEKFLPHYFGPDGACRQQQPQEPNDGNDGIGDGDEAKSSRRTLPLPQPGNTRAQALRERATETVLAERTASARNAFRPFKAQPAPHYVDAYFDALQPPHENDEEPRYSEDHHHGIEGDSSPSRELEYNDQQGGGDSGANNKADRITTTPTTGVYVTTPRSRRVAAAEERERAQQRQHVQEVTEAEARIRALEAQVREQLNRQKMMGALHKKEVVVVKEEKKEPAAAAPPPTKKQQSPPPPPSRTMQRFYRTIGYIDAGIDQLQLK